MTKNIFICGFMGSGKTVIGKKLANSLGRKFIDLDKIIEKNENMKIKDIFKLKGEEYFRNLETNILLDACKNSNSIISLGGGILESQKNINTIHKNGVILFIDIPFDLCYLRISEDKNRPLVVSNSKEELEAIYNKRKDIYIKNCNCKTDFIGTIFQTVEHLKFKLKTENYL